MDTVAQAFGHNEANRMAIELWTNKLVPTRVRAVNHAFDAVEEATGFDLTECRKEEIANATKADLKN